MSTTTQSAPYLPVTRLRRSSRTEVPAWNLAETWLALIPLLFFTVRGTFSFEGAAGNNQMSGTYGTLMAASINSPRHNIELVSFYGIICLLLLPFYKTVLTEFARNKLLLALPLFSILSTVWSQYPNRSLMFGATALLNTGFGIYLIRRFTPRQQMQLFTLLGTITIISSYLLIALAPSIGLDHKENFAHAWQGIFGHKNHCAMMMIYMLVPVFCLDLKTSLQRVLRLLYVSAALLMIGMSSSRTGWLLLASTLIFLGIMVGLKHFSGKDRLLLATTISAVAILLVTIGYLEFAHIAVMLGKDPTLTGRTEIWAAVMHPIMKRPLLGYGYNAFWVGFKGEAATTAMMIGAANLGNAENGVLQLWLELGAVGVLLMFLLLLQSIHMAVLCFNRSNVKYMLWPLAVVFMTTAMLIDGDKFMFPHTLEWTAFVMVYAGMHRELSAATSEGFRE